MKGFLDKGARAPVAAPLVKEVSLSYLCPMRARLYSFAFLSLMSLAAAAQPPLELSGEAQISALTCTPWQGELYTAFGHSAIRVYDPSLGIDLVFNYGVFDFHQPHFYINFTKGNLLYCLDVAPYADFMYTYIAQSRQVIEQVLNLTADQKHRIFAFLWWNAQPENRNYLYDYFYDNCSTRIRDVFVHALADELKLDSSFVRTGPTLRDVVGRYLKQQPWGHLGIDVSLGLPMDKRISAYEYMFLPDYLEAFLDRATLASREGAPRPLVAEKRVALRAAPALDPPHPPHPWIVFGGLMLVALGVSAYDIRRGAPSYWFDAPLLFGVGLFGLLLLVFWTCTSHSAADNNLNVLWALPTHALMVFWLRSSRRRFVAFYFGAALCLAAVLLLAWPWFPQQFNVFFIPVILALMARYAVNYVLLRR